MLDSLAPGGAERSTVALLPHLIDRGFRLDVATLHDRPGLQGAVAEAGVEVHDLSGPGRRVGWIRRTRDLLTALQPDLLHTSLFEADVTGRTAAFLARVPAVTTLPTERYGAAHLSAPHLSTAKVRLAQATDIATVRFARRLHAVSHHVADTMAGHLRYPRDRIDVVHRGRAPSDSDPASAAEARCGLRRELDLGDRPTILLASRHEQAKGIDRALRAMPPILASLPDAILLVAGREGEQTATLTSMVGELGVEASVRFVGHRDDVAALHRAADVFVLPSRREGLPGALLEAMAEENPAVVNDLPQVREVVSPDEAHIVDAADPQALAGAIGEVLTHRTAAAAMASAALGRFLDGFTLDRAADGMADFYRRSLR